MKPRRAVAALVAATLAVLLSAPATPAAPVAPAAPAAPARINGAGSTYVALAMQQWVADAQSQGLAVNYLPTGSPDGLTSYGNGLIDFAGTEAEFSALTGGGGGGTPGDRRGYQYVPDVAGAIAVMYNVQDRAGREVDYLHLSPRTVARIFTGDIERWSDPAISADNLGLELPDEPITVVYRSGQSGTTALFYDFIANVAPDVFEPWARENQLPTSVRIIQLDSTPRFAPRTQALNGSDQIAQHVSSSSGRWSIAYDEFGYAVTYGANAAWIQNASGAWVLPYAANISAALKSARLRPDLSQELSGVYSSTNPDAYPISAYSYLVTQCAQAGDRPTCQGNYDNGGVSETLAQWMRYIACDGQVNMARIGYSPLPPNLSQEIANSIARMTGGSPERLSASNCANPRFGGSLGGGAESPEDPLAGSPPLGAGPGSSGDGGGGGGDSDGTGSTTPGGSSSEAAAGAGTTPGAVAGAAGRSGAVTAIGGGSTDVRDALPVEYDRPALPGPSGALVVVLLAAVAAPALVAALNGRRRRRAV